MNDKIMVMMETISTVCLFILISHLFRLVVYIKKRQASEYIDQYEVKRLIRQLQMFVGVIIIDIMYIYVAWKEGNLLKFTAFLAAELLILIATYMFIKALIQCSRKQSLDCSNQPPDSSHEGRDSDQ